MMSLTICKFMYIMYRSLNESEIGSLMTAVKIRREEDGTWIGCVPRILDDRTRLPPLLLVDDPLVLFQLVVAHAVERVLRVRRLEHRRVVLEVPLDDALARRPNLKRKIFKVN